MDKVITEKDIDLMFVTKALAERIERSYDDGRALFFLPLSYDSTEETVDIECENGKLIFLCKHEEDISQTDIFEILHKLGAILYHSVAGRSEFNDEGMILFGYDELSIFLWPLIKGLLERRLRSLEELKRDLNYLSKKMNLQPMIKKDISKETYVPNFVLLNDSDQLSPPISRPRPSLPPEKLASFAPRFPRMDLGDNGQGINETIDIDLGSFEDNNDTEQSFGSDRSGSGFNTSDQSEEDKNNSSEEGLPNREIPAPSDELSSLSAKFEKKFDAAKSMPVEDTEEGVERRLGATEEAASSLKELLEATKAELQNRLRNQ